MDDIKYRMMPDGAFVVGSVKTGRTSYAYPTSIHANRAKRSPETVAKVMAANADSDGSWRDNFDDYDLRNWKRING